MFCFGVHLRMLDGNKTSILINGVTLGGGNPEKEREKSERNLWGEFCLLFWLSFLALFILLGLAYLIDKEGTHH